MRESTILIEELEKALVNEDLAHQEDVLQQGKMHGVQQGVKRAKKPRVLIIVGRDYSSSVLSSVYLSGTDGYYNELIQYAGGENVIKDITIGISGLSLEALIKLAPDVIIEIVPPEVLLSDDELLAPWKKFVVLPAVKNHNLYFLKETWAYTPGPRFTLLLERLREIVSGMG